MSLAGPTIFPETMLAMALHPDEQRMTLLGCETATTLKHSIVISKIAIALNSCGHTVYFYWSLKTQK